MNQRKFVILILGLIAVIQVVILALPLGPLPPLGEFFSPFQGVWNRGKSKAPYKDLQSLKKVLHGQARVQIDQKEIPHIFVQFDEDLYFVQGYLTATQRLFEMEVMARSAAGRLSEILGSKTQKLDEHMIRMDLLGAAEKALEIMKGDSLTWMAVQAYSRGVNYYINSLKAEDYPFEFKLLSTKPERWSPLKTALILKLMAYRLSGHSFDLDATRSFLALKNPDLFKELFPTKALYGPPTLRAEDYKMPNSLEADPAAPPGALEVLTQLNSNDLPDPSSGSNAWAVTGDRSQTGQPLLSNDIHLEYQLPSLWYLMHLQSPTQNVIGVSIPGSPGIIIGTNEEVAWSTTNGGSDVLDWYQIQFENSKHNTYLYEGQKRAVFTKTRTLHIKDKPDHFIQLKFTHHGPIYHESSTGQKGLALRWHGHNPSNEIGNFLRLNRATDVESCLAALDGYETPQQVFICADEKDIAARAAGELPLRWEGQGQLLLDGTQNKMEWKDMLTADEIPSVIRPRSPFLFSANQNIFGNEYPHYLDWSYDLGYRAQRISDLLEKRGRPWTAVDFMQMQGDSYSLLAEQAVPLLISLIKTEEMKSSELQILNRLKAWNFEHQKDSFEAVFFTQWFRSFEELTWREFGLNGEHVLKPTTAILLQYLKGQKKQMLFDQFKQKNAKEAYQHSMQSLQNQLGGQWKKWQWKEYQKTELPHLLRIPKFGRKANLGGAPSSIFSNKGQHGPVWKMVVSMKKPVRIWGIYPGGQSGDVMSAKYADWVTPWEKNEMMELPFWHEPKSEGVQVDELIGVKK